MLDSTACNYDASATTATWIDATQATYDCDFDANSAWMPTAMAFADELTLMDAPLMNYAGATDLTTGHAPTADEFYDCDGNCTLERPDSDGVCDELEAWSRRIWRATTTPSLPRMTTGRALNWTALVIAVAAPWWTNAVDCDRPGSHLRLRMH